MAIKPMFHTNSHLDLGNTINPQGLQSMVKKAIVKRQKQILSKRTSPFKWVHSLQKSSRNRAQSQVSH